MAGKTGYTPISNGSPMEGPEQITDVYEHFDDLIDQVKANIAALPISGNWLGRRIIANDTKIVYRWNGAAWKAWESGWITYTAALTNLTVGTGGSALAVTKYRYVGGEVEVDLLFVLGTSGSGVGTNPTVALPMSVAPVAHPTAIYSGAASLFDVTPGAMRPAIVVADTVVNYIRLYMVTAGVTQAYDSITSGAPWGWAAGDAIHARFWVTPA